jgi:uncharacterized protein with GYD domain
MEGKSQRATNNLFNLKGGKEMATYVLFGQYTLEGLRGISTDRTEKASELVEKFGGSVKAGYALLGKNDLVMVIEAPNTEAVMKISVGLSKMSGISFTTAPAVTFEEFDQYMEEV